ncbi:MAG: hypothetical protein AB1635_20805 [Acidobacteriota bacterium]
MTGRAYRAGESIEDYCRACRIDRQHTVMAVDDEGQPIRVVCGYCRSEHNYRGGPRMAAPGARPAVSVHRAVGESPAPPARPTTPGRSAPERPPAERRSATSEHGTLERRTAPPAARAPFPTVSARERSAPPMATGSTDDLELLLRRIIREESGISPVAPAEKWRGGQLVLRPGTPGVQEKSWPIETFFHKVVMLRNRLRTLEQQLNASDLPDDVKVKLQGYVTGCYGSLTSFNVLFADEGDHFKGSGGD